MASVVLEVETKQELNYDESQVDPEGDPPAELILGL